MTKYHRLGDSYNRKLFPHSCSGQKSKIKASADSGPGEGSLPVLQTAAFLLGHDMAFSWCMASLQWEKKCRNRNVLGWEQNTFSVLKTTFCIFTIHPFLEGRIFFFFFCGFCGLVLTWEYGSMMDKHGFLSNLRWACLLGQDTIRSATLLTYVSSWAWVWLQGERIRRNLKLALHSLIYLVMILWYAIMWEKRK